MSDNARSTLAFPVIAQTAEDVVSKLADALDRSGESILLADPMAPPTFRTLFRPIANEPAKYHRPEYLENTGLDPTDKPGLVRSAMSYRDLAIHTTFDIAGKFYRGSVLIYNVEVSVDAEIRSFVRFGFQSELTYDLRGTREFGGKVTVNREIKADLLRMAFLLCDTLHAGGFVFGLERAGPSPFSITQLANYLRAPTLHNVPFAAFMLGIDTSLVSYAKLLDVWRDEDAVQQSTSGLVVLDLLFDSDGVADD